MDNKPLLKSHRVIGYEVGRMPNPDAPGKELVILRTDPSPTSGMQVTPAHTLMPATIQEVLLRLRVDIRNALDQALFLGATPADVEAAVAAELEEARATA